MLSARAADDPGGDPFDRVVGFSVASGSASMREYVQRLGRVLRPKPTEAMLYELISRRTTERNASRRRRPKTSAIKAAEA